MDKSIHRLGGSDPIFAHGRMCVFPFFPMGKNGKTHISPWAKMGLDPPPPF